MRDVGPAGRNVAKVQVRDRSSMAFPARRHRGPPPLASRQRLPAVDPGQPQEASARDVDLRRPPTAGRRVLGYGRSCRTFGFGPHPLGDHRHPRADGTHLADRRADRCDPPGAILWSDRQGDGAAAWVLRACDRAPTRASELCRRGAAEAAGASRAAWISRAVSTPTRAISIPAWIEVN